LTVSVAGALARELTRTCGAADGDESVRLLARKIAA
jgi:hypothetical protein